MTISGRKKVDPAAFEGTDIPLMARVTGLSNAVLVQADVSSITRAVYQKGDSGSASGITPVSSYIYNTLQTAEPWDQDESPLLGYNFRDNLPNSALTSGGVWYVDYEITDSNSKKIAFGFEINVIAR